jgi:hypothetical protein
MDGDRSAEGAEACERRQIFRGSKLAQASGGVNAMGLRNAAKRAKMWPAMLPLNCAVRRPAVSLTSRFATISLRAVSILVLLLAVAAHAQDKDADAKAQAGSGSKDVKLTIVVTGGDEKKPVDSASVYIRFVEEHKHGRDKKIEMNLKTNQSGICHVPVIPPGKFVIQVIAEGWKTYGEYYDINQTEQTININLARPPKWY